MNNNIELCSKLLVIWIMNSGDKEVMFSPGYEEKSFIAKMLRKKLEVFKINVKLPDPLIMLIEICTGSNPGLSQIMLKEVLMKCKKSGNLTPDQVFVPTALDFTETFLNMFPIIEEFPQWEEYFHKAWDAQKDENGANKCDTPEWWMEIYS